MTYENLMEAPITLNGDVCGKIEECRLFDKKDGTESLKLGLAVSDDGVTWYKLTAYISNDDRFGWLRKAFFLALGYDEATADIMQITDSSKYAEWLTYVMLRVEANGKYLNVRRWYPKQKDNYMPTPWHKPWDEKFGGVEYQVPKKQEPLKSIEETIDRMAKEPELKPQKIDLSWVLTDNLIAELESRGLKVSQPLTGYDFGEDDLEF